ncbi:MAG: formate/nitrite transporter family protein [Gemmatimonadales bacterium]
MRKSSGLNAGEDVEAKKRTAPRVAIVYEAIHREGMDELARPGLALAFSGLAAGLSMGFSMVAEGLLAAGLPDAGWAHLVSKLGYSVGFLIVVLGRQQLFTENTLTPILPFLQDREWSTLVQVARLWGIVLLANIVGAFLFALIVSQTRVLTSGTADAILEFSREMVEPAFGTTFVRAIFAGWLIALMVWLLPFAESGRVLVIILITWLVGLGSFSHIIAGSVEAGYLLFLGEAGPGILAWRFFLPTLLGNIIGGVALVTAINHAQVVSGTTETS